MDVLERLGVWLCRHEANLMEDSDATDHTVYGISSFPYCSDWDSSSSYGHQGSQELARYLGEMKITSNENEKKFSLLEEHDFDSEEDRDFFYFYNITGTLFCIAFVALIAGLFLGLLTLDAMDLQIIERASMDDDEKKYARALYPIVKGRHQLLVTLLLLNALAYETLPIFLDALVPSWVAILLSVTFVMIFGEIIPSAIFTGPEQLRLGYYMVPLVKFFLVVVYPFARPLAMILDHIVFPDGEDEEAEDYNRGELAALVQIQLEKRQKKNKHKMQSHSTSIQRMSQLQTAVHQKELARHKQKESWGALKKEMLEAVSERMEEGGISGSTPGGPNDEAEGGTETVIDISMDQELSPPMEKLEVDLVVGALQMKTKVVSDVYTPLRKVYRIPDDLVLDRKGMSDIYAMGYSRVPIYHVTGEVSWGEDAESGDDEEDGEVEPPFTVLGYLMTRQLMLIDWDHEREVSTLPLERPLAVSPRFNLVEALKLLKDRGSLMAFVCARPDLANKALKAEKPVPIEAGFMGIITLEDIMESILQDRIYDEWDIRDRDRAVSTLNRWAARVLTKFARKKLEERGRRGSASSAASRMSVSPQKKAPTKLSLKTSDMKIATENMPLLA